MIVVQRGSSGVIPRGELGVVRDGSCAGDEMEWGKRLFRGATGAFMVRVAGAGLGLLVHIVLARLLGVDQYGLYTFALSWVSVIAVLGVFGQDTSVLRFVATYVQRGQWGELRGLRRLANVTGMIVSISISLSGIAFVFLIRSTLTRSETLTFVACCLLLPFLIQLQLNGAFLQGLKRAASSGFFNSILRPAAFISMLIVLGLIFRIRMDASIAMFSSVLAVLLSMAISEWFLRRVWPGQSTLETPKYHTRSWLRLGRQLFFLAAIGVTLNRVDVLVLGGLSGIDQVGPYYAAVQLAAIALYGLNAVNTILAPMIAECYASRDHDRLKRLVHRAAWFTFSVTAAASLATAIAGHWLLGMFGKGFIVAYVPLLIILAGQCVNAAVGPVGFLMTMTRFESQAPWIFGGGAALNLSLSIVLIPYFGITGAAIATASATVAWNLVALAFIRRNLGINPTVFPWPA